MDFLAPEGVLSYILKIPPRNTLYKMYEPHFIVLYCAQRTQLSLKMNQKLNIDYFTSIIPSVRSKHRLSRYSSYINEPCRSICARASFHALSTASNSLICSILQTHLSSSIRRPAKLLQVCRRIMVPRHGRHRNHSVHTTLQASFFFLYRTRDNQVLCYSTTATRFTTQSHCNL